MSIVRERLLAMKDLDANSAGFTDRALDPLRYDGQAPDPSESTGIILSMIPFGARVLDVGCGTGWISTLVRDIRRCTVVGIEPHAERAMEAGRRGINLVAGELNGDSVLALGRFDVVLFADVLEHMPDPLSVLRLSRDLLESRGCLITSVPNVAHWTVRLSLLRGRFNYDVSGIMDATHLRWFTAKGITQILSRAGYDVVEFRASAGVWMHEYNQRPWSWLSPRLRNAVIRRTTLCFPALFGCQHVVKAVIHRNSGDDSRAKS